MHYKAFKISLKFRVRTFTLVGLLQSLGFVELHYGFELRTLNTPFKRLVSTSSHVQVTKTMLVPTGLIRCRCAQVKSHLAGASVM